MQILLATSNPHKIEEIRAIFAACAAKQQPGARATPRHVELLSLADVDPNRRIPEPVEDGDTFEANATLKAEAYARASGMWTLADDSGLAVDALGGEPGVISARYAGLDGPRDVVDPANNRLLLQRLTGVPAPQRTARFVCVMVLAAPANHHTAQTRQTAAAQPEVDLLATVQGTIEGQIIPPEQAADPTKPERGRGNNGFGYDPLFLLPQRGMTSAELTPAEKNLISHRGNAARQMWAELQSIQPANTTQQE